MRVQSDLACMNWQKSFKYVGVVSGLVFQTEKGNNVIGVDAVKTSEFYRSSNSIALFHTSNDPGSFFMEVAFAKF